MLSRREGPGGGRAEVPRERAGRTDGTKWPTRALCSEWAKEGKLDGGFPLKLNSGNSRKAIVVSK